MCSLAPFRIAASCRGALLQSPAPAAGPDHAVVPWPEQALLSHTTHSAVTSVSACEPTFPRVQGSSEVGFGWLLCNLLILKRLFGLQIRLDQFDSGSRLQKFIAKTVQKALRGLFLFCVRIIACPCCLVRASPVPGQAPSLPLSKVSALCEWFRACSSVT